MLDRGGTITSDSNFVWWKSSGSLNFWERECVCVCLCKYACICVMRSIPILHLKFSCKGLWILLSTEMWFFFLAEILLMFHRNHESVAPEISHRLHSIASQETVGFMNTMFSVCLFQLLKQWTALYEIWYELYACRK